MRYKFLSDYHPISGRFTGEDLFFKTVLQLHFSALKQGRIQKHIFADL